jgi:hypothetical protein
MAPSQTKFVQRTADLGPANLLQASNHFNPSHNGKVKPICARTLRLRSHRFRPVPAPKCPCYTRRTYEPSAHDIAGLAPDGRASAACGGRHHGAVVRALAATTRRCRACASACGPCCCRCRRTRPPWRPRRACRRSSRGRQRTWGRLDVVARVLQRMLGLLCRRSRAPFRFTSPAELRRFRRRGRRSRRLRYRLHSGRPAATSPALIHAIDRARAA